MSVSSKYEQIISPPTASASPSSQVTASALWLHFSRAVTVDDFCQSWLALICHLIPQVECGTVFLETSPFPTGFKPKGIWPSGSTDISHLEPTVQRALTQREGLLLKSEGSRNTFEVAYPLEVDAQLHGVVVLELAPRSDVEFSHVRRQLYWASAWMEVLVRRQNPSPDDVPAKQLHSMLDMVATVCRHDRFHEAATALVTDLATTLHCDRVSLGVLQRGKSRVRALSHSAQIDKQTNLFVAIAEAMDEAIDQQTTVVLPASEKQPSHITTAHQTLAEEWGSGAICTIPLTIAGQIVGALMLERPSNKPFDQTTLDLCEATGSLVGPILETLRREDRWWLTKGWDAAMTHLKHLVGPRHAALKLSTIILTALLIFFSTVEGDYRVSAITVLEPVVLRALVAPFEGFVAEAPTRAGDLVKHGEVLTTLDDRELQLERLKWMSQFEEVRQKYHQAMALHKLSKVTILSAQMDQAQAQLSLVNDQLTRTQIHAPFDAVVVSGDLSQELGSPVEKGQVLFEVAPLDSYRLIVQVDERDVREIAVGQRGTLKLSSIPGDTFAFTVLKLTPVSEAEEGRNYFRVEAQLDETPERLRPGMEGVGKIDIDQRLLFWIWTHDIGDWVRLTWWSWTP